MDVTENGLRAAVKSLTDVVAPAINPNDPLAAEQLKLVVDYLEFVRGRLDFLCYRETFELRDNLALARAIQNSGAIISPENKSLLESSIETGTEVLSSHELKSNVIRLAAFEIAAVVREVIRESASYEESIRRKLETLVLEMSVDRITFDRAWYLPLGFDPSPKEVPHFVEVAEKNR